MSGEWLTGRRVIASIVVGTLLIASVVAALLVWSSERRHADEANAALARQAAAVAQRTVELTAASLRGGEGVLRRSGPMPERGFRRFARDVISETPFPSLAWAPRVPARERERFERILGRAIGEPRPATERKPNGGRRRVAERSGAYLPIRLVHPNESRERRELGIDLLSDPPRAIAARAARDSGKSMLTRPIASPGQGTHVVVVDPVYAPGERLSSVRRRQLALSGMLSGQLPAEAIGAEIADQLGADVEVSIDDREIPFLAGAAGHEGDTEAVEVDVLGHDWSVRVSEVESAAVLPALAVGAVGVTLAALAAALFALARRREELLSRERDLAAKDAETQRTTSSTLQQALLPPSLPEVEGLASAAAYRPGEEGLDVGGDFYDLFRTGRRWTAVIGDVSGKGADAAALTALVRHTARAFAEEGPGAAIEEVNRAIRGETGAGTFATMCICSLDPTPQGTTMSIAVAGHPPPVIARADGTTDAIAPTAPLVGVVEEPRVSETQERLDPGETLLLYTDGLIEAHGPDGGILGEDRVRAAVAAARDLEVDELIEELLARATEFAPNFPQDDVAILALRSKP